MQCGGTRGVCVRGTGRLRQGSGRSEFREGVWAVWAWGCWGGAGGSAAGRRGVALLLLRRCWGALGAAAGRRSVLFVRGVRGARFRGAAMPVPCPASERGEEAKVGRNGGMRRPGQLVGCWRGGGEAGSLLSRARHLPYCHHLSVVVCGAREKGGKANVWRSASEGERASGGWPRPQSQHEAACACWKGEEKEGRGRLWSTNLGAWRPKMTNIPRESNRHTGSYTHRPLPR